VLGEHFAEPKIVEINGWTTDGAKAGPAFRALAGKVKLAVEKCQPILHSLFH
jgi:hypothetical protein